MAKSDDKLCSARLQRALEMQQLGIEMYRLKLRRDDPAASEDAILDRLAAWLHRPPEVEWPYRIVRSHFGSSS
jgi:hypothetical protein